MSKIVNNINKKIRDGIDKIYGIANLPSAQRKSANRTLVYSARMSLKMDTAKAKLLRFLQSQRGQRFVDDYQLLPPRIILMKYHLPSLIIHKSSTVLNDMITDVINRANIVPTVAIIPNKQDYSKHPQPKNLTSGRQKKYFKHDWNTKDDPVTGWPAVYKDWGKWIRPLSEVGRIEKQRIQLGKFTFESRMEQLLNHKMEKWVKRNPAPTESDLKRDLFPDLMKVAWNTKEHAAREHIRDLIRQKYDKKHIPIIGRFQASTGYKEQIIGRINDPNQEIQKLGPAGDIEERPLNIIIQAQSIVDNVRKKSPSLICGRISSGKQERVLIPHIPGFNIMQPVNKLAA